MILTMDEGSDDVLSIGGETGTGISGNVGSASVTVVSGAQLTLVQGKEWGNNQYDIGQQNPIAHLAPACVAVLLLSDLESISVGDGVGDPEVCKKEFNFLWKVRATLIIGLFGIMMRYR